MSIRASVRPASAADAAAIAAVHAASWRSAYRGIMPDAYLDARCAAERLAYWQATLATAPPSRVVLVAELDGSMVGFAAARMEPDEGFEACLDNLHVIASCRGQGVGRLLLGTLARQMATNGCRSLYLWVFDANSAAIRFYQRLGAMAVERGAEQFAGTDIPHTRLAWSDSARLAEACGH